MKTKNEPTYYVIDEHGTCGTYGSDPLTVSAAIQNGIKEGAKVENWQILLATRVPFAVRRDPQIEIGKEPEKAPAKKAKGVKVAAPVKVEAATKAKKARAPKVVEVDEATIEAVRSVLEQGPAGMENLSKVAKAGKDVVSAALSKLGATSSGKARGTRYSLPVATPEHVNGAQA